MVFLIVDEVYREFTYDGISHTSIMEFDEISENAIVIDSVSKRYSMWSWGGCIISKKQRVFKYSNEICSSEIITSFPSSDC